MSLIKIAEDIESGQFNDANYNKLRVAEFLRQESLRFQKLEEEVYKAQRKTLKLLDLIMIREEQPNKPSGDWWKGDPTCGGLTENYGLGKVKDERK